MPITLPTVQDTINNFLDNVPDKGMNGSPNLNNAEIFGVKPAGSGNSGGVRTTPAPRVNPNPTTPPATPPAPSLPSNYTPTTFGDADGTRTLNTSREQNASLQNANELARYTQALTDSVNSKYAGLISRQEDTNKANDARAYVLNSNRGLTDSGTGSAALNTEEAKGKDAIAKLEAQQQSEIQVALGKADSLKQNQARTEIAQQQKDDNTYKTMKAQNRKDAEGALASFANGNVDLETLKSKEPDTYKNIQKELGYSDLEMASKFNSLKKNPAKMNFKVTGDHVVMYGVDSKGNMTVHDQVVPGLGNGQWEVTQTTDGRVLQRNTQTGEYKSLGAGASGSSGQTSYSKNEETDAKNWLARQSGFDNSKDYQAFDSDPSFKAWAIQQAAAEKAASKKTPTGANPFS